MIGADLVNFLKDCPHLLGILRIVIARVRKSFKMSITQ